MTTRRPVVIKFGGAALERPSEVVRRVRGLCRDGTPVVLVVSAREGVTDWLHEIVEHPDDRRRHVAAVAAIERLHPQMSISGGELLQNLRRATLPTGTVDGRSRRRSEHLLSLGERLAAHWVSEALSREGLPAVPVEADVAGLVIHRIHGRPEIDLRTSGRLLRPYLRRILQRGSLPVVTGYFGRSRTGGVVTLGRGSSDYSATAIGAILGASRVELVKRRASVRTADPLLVAASAAIVRLSYDEAEELARFGARVLHPLSLDPARHAGFEVWVRAQDDPDACTIVGPPRPGGGIRAVTVLSPLALLPLRLPGTDPRSSTVTDLARRLTRAQIEVVTWLNVPGGLGIIVNPAAAELWRRTFGRSPVGPLPAEPPIPVDLVTAVGDRIISDFGRVPRSVLRAALGVAVTTRSLSFAVPRSMTLSTLEAIHRELVETVREDPWEVPSSLQGERRTDRVVGLTLPPERTRVPTRKPRPLTVDRGKNSRIDRVSAATRAKAIRPQPKAEG
jgi:aspartate kinase